MSGRLELEQTNYRCDFEARRRATGIEQLWRLSERDTTIRAFLDAWRHGGFQSFEEMMCQLAVQLANEKEEYMKTATVQLANAPIAPVIIRG